MGKGNRRRRRSARSMACGVKVVLGSLGMAESHAPACGTPSAVHLPVGLCGGGKAGGVAGNRQQVRTLLPVLRCSSPFFYMQFEPGEIRRWPFASRL